MITLVTVKNPFKPQDGREVRRIDYTGSLQELFQENSITEADIHVTVNGYDVDKDYDLKDGDFVVICPAVEKGGGKGGGKSILGIVAAIALSVVSFGVGNVLAIGKGSFFALGGATWGAASYIAAAAVMFLGSSLMGRFMGAKTDMGKYDTGNQSEESTYSWGGVRTMEGQNNAIPLTYGKVKSGGQTIGKFVSVADNKEYLNWLVCAGEGELAISDIKLNDNPIGNYTGVSVELRSGTNNQSVISNFNDTYFTKTVNYKLGSSWTTDTSQGTQTDGLIMDINFPGGLCHVNNEGKKENASVSVAIEYKKSGGSWTAMTSNKFTVPNSYGVTAGSSIGAGSYTLRVEYHTEYDEGWTRWYTASINGQTKTVTKGKTYTIGGFTVNTSNWNMSDMKNKNFPIVVTIGYLITASQQSALRRQFRVNNLSRGQYDVRVRVTYRSHSETDMQSSTSCYLTGITSVVYDDFSYPGLALIGIKALASDQINGVPSLTFMKERSTVWVWNGSSYVTKPANNPAWAAYDFVHQARRMINIHTNQYEFEVRGARKELMRYNDFENWAAWCDSKNLKINIEINTTGEMLDMVNKHIANVGHGMVVRFGTKYGCIYSHKATPVQMFGMGNIISGSFQETFVKTSDRANAVEVTFTNAATGYERDTITIYGSSYNSDPEQKTAQITMNGITNYNQAYREGLYQLACNKYQKCTISFTASIDAIACTVGDVILVAHDVPKWAHSGRVEEINGTSVKLPCELESGWQNNSYILQWRTVKDNLYSMACTVNSSADGWTMVTLASAPSSSDPLQKNDIFDLAIANTGAKPFVVNSITRAQDFTRSIGCIEYADALYDENYNVPVINYSEATTNRALNVKGLNAVQTQYADTTGTRHGRLSVSWDMPSNGGRFNVFISPNNRDWEQVKSQYSATDFEMDVLPNQAYYVRVVTTLGMTSSSGVVIGPISPGIDELPPDITRFDVEKMASGLRRYWWEFEYPALNDIAGFRLKYTQSRKLIWEAGIPVQEGLVTSQPFETQTVRQGAHAIMIKAVDNAGQESKNFAYCLLDLGDLLEENVLWTKDFSENNWADVEHDGIISDGGIVSRNTANMWSDPGDFRWSSPTEDAWQPTFETLNAEMTFVAPASGQFWIKADIDGPGIVYYCKSHTANHWTYTNAPRWTDPDDVQWTMVYDMWKQWSDRVLIDAGDIVHIKVVGLNETNKKTKINGITAYIDVPDLEEHFENLPIAVTGTTLPIKTPHYYTTAVRLDAVQNGNAVSVKYLSRTPCQIQLLDRNGDPTTGEVDVTWQGFRKETL